MTFKKKGEYYTSIDKAKDLVPKFRENFQRFSKSDYIEIAKARLGFVQLVRVVKMGEWSS